MINYLIKRYHQNPEPEVGMGATHILHSDRHAYTIVEVVSEREIVVQRDIATRTDNRGMSDAQSYIFEPNPDAPRITLTKRSNGHWYAKGVRTTEGSPYIIGVRTEYFDFSF